MNTYYSKADVFFDDKTNKRAFGNWVTDIDDVCSAERVVQLEYDGQLREDRIRHTCNDDSIEVIKATIK